ncbi:hypothetical protein EON63_05630 [archaeon]|nr:MAG: hypothetical protein EON63_05630 [archaeon]
MCWLLHLRIPINTNISIHTYIYKTFSYTYTYSTGRLDLTKKELKAREIALLKQEALERGETAQDEYGGMLVCVCVYV